MANIALDRLGYDTNILAFRHAGYTAVVECNLRNIQDDRLVYLLERSAIKSFSMIGTREMRKSSRYESYYALKDGSSPGSPPIPGHFQTWQGTQAGR